MHRGDIWLACFGCKRAMLQLNTHMYNIFPSSAHRGLASFNNVLKICP